MRHERFANDGDGNAFRHPVAGHPIESHDAVARIRGKGGISAGFDRKREVRKMGACIKRFACVE